MSEIKVGDRIRIHDDKNQGTIVQVNKNQVKKW